MINTKKATREQTKQHNKQLVLNTIYGQDRISRVEVARLTSLTRTTVSSVVSELMDEGLVAEVGVGPSAGGKPPILLSVVDDSYHLIGLDLANGKFRGAVFNLRGKIRHRVEIPIDGQGGDEALELVYQLSDQLLKATHSSLLGIGIGAPGVIDPLQGIVRQAVNLKWENLSLVALLRDRYGLPVYLVNDSHAAALGEYTFGQHDNATSLIVVKIGRGIGAGIVINGQLFYGNGYGAGEIGHVVVAGNGQQCQCGNYGCLETVAGSRALLKEAITIAQNNPQSQLNQFSNSPEQLSMDQVIEAFNNGDKSLEPFLANAGRYLAVTIANLIGALNIEHIVIAGRVANFGPAILIPLQTELHKRILSTLVARTKIVTSNINADVVKLGAAALLLTSELGLT
ncbi:ROK family transcriptional regulator [Anaerolineales bacterium HSG24]|nr:ROK family transcriptional regulator [Anaerolineales bacterium HSG24]